MRRSHNNRGTTKMQTGASATALPDWRSLGCTIRRKAMVAASLHLAHKAGCNLEDGAVLETPRDYSGG